MVGNYGAGGFPRANCVHQLFEIQAERNPDATAVVFKERELTYRELNGRANGLAVRPPRRGVVPPVALPPLFGESPRAEVCRLDDARRTFEERERKV